MCVCKMYQTNKGEKNVNSKLRVQKPGATEINITIKYNYITYIFGPPLYSWLQIWTLGLI